MRWNAEIVKGRRNQNVPGDYRLEVFQYRMIRRSWAGVFTCMAERRTRCHEAEG